MKTLFISGLDMSINDTKLQDIFSPFGVIKSAHVMINSLGISHGCGVVEMSSDSEAQNCIDMLNHTILLDRTLIVEFKDSPVKRNKSRNHSFVNWMSS